MGKKKKENQSIRLKGQLRLYMQWPAIMAVLLVIVNIWTYKIDRRAGTLMFIFVLIYDIFQAVLDFTELFPDSCAEGILLV